MSSGRTRALTRVLVTGAWACNAILGIGQPRRLDPAAGAGGGGAAIGGDGGAAGTGGTGGQPGDCSGPDDCPQGDCFGSVCNEAHICVPKNLASGTSCQDGKKCNGQGQCVACLGAVDCPAVPCQVASCTAAGECVHESSPEGDVDDGQHGNCCWWHCDGSGNHTDVAHDDPPAPSQDCKKWVCKGCGVAPVEENAENAECTNPEEPAAKYCCNGTCQCGSADCYDGNCG